MIKKTVLNFATPTSLLSSARHIARAHPNQKNMTKNNLIPPCSILLFCLMSFTTFAQSTVGDTLSIALMDEIKGVQVLNH